MTSAEDDIDALLAEMNGDEGGEEAPTAEPAAADSPPGEDDIDSLLAEMFGQVNDVAENDPNQSQGGGEIARTDSDLSQEEIDSLVAKEDGTDEDSEALIDQNDIDALVRQMSEATSTPDVEHVTHMLQKRGGDIEALLNEAAKNVDTSDAISEIASFDETSASGDKVVYGPPVNAIAPGELRGTRFLLAAAVFLLAMCTAAMVFVVSSINRLSSELHANRETVATPTDDYSEDLQVATDMLNYEDEIESQKGVELLKRMRNRHRDVNKEIEVTLILARHFLANGRAEEAVAEYATVADRQGGLANDPTFYIEWATAYDSMNASDDAQRIAGVLLANEEYFLTNSDGEPVDEETYNRNERIIRQAQLLMGRIALAQGSSGLNAANLASVKATE